MTLIDFQGVADAALKYISHCKLFVKIMWEATANLEEVVCKGLHAVG